MSEENKDQLKKDHNYDGIEEYDNNLPKWWLATFYLTLIFGFIYWSRFYVFHPDSYQGAEYQAAYEAHQKKIASQEQNLDDIDFTALKNDPKVVSQGKETFGTYCAACHGANGEGGIGPNLADQYWIHGFEPTTMVKIVVNGVSEKGMTPWKGILSPTQINEVVAYVLTLEGTDPENAKAAEGDIIKDI